MHSSGSFKSREIPRKSREIPRNPAKSQRPTIDIHHEWILFRIFRTLGIRCCCLNLLPTTGTRGNKFFFKSRKKIVVHHKPSTCRRFRVVDCLLTVSMTMFCLCVRITSKVVVYFSNAAEKMCPFGDYLLFNGIRCDGLQYGTVVWWTIILWSNLVTYHRNKWKQFFRPRSGNFFKLRFTLKCLRTECSALLTICWRWQCFV